MRQPRALFSLATSFLFVLLSGSVRAQVVADAGSRATICPGGPVTLGGAAATGGTAPYQYSWAPAAGLNNPNVLHPVCTTSTTRTYTLTVTDADGATATSQVTITVNPSPGINLSCTNATPSTYGGVLTFSVCGLGVNTYDFQFTDASTALPGATFSMDWGNGRMPTPAVRVGPIRSSIIRAHIGDVHDSRFPPNGPQCCLSRFVGEVPWAPQRGLQLVHLYRQLHRFEWNN